MAGTAMAVPRFCPLLHSAHAQLVKMGVAKQKWTWSAIFACTLPTPSG